jgi:C4-dicarboxylate-specific signal transduction histidine kinase
MRLAIAERESQLRAAQAELIHREKLAAMGRLVAQLSHEINNPIYNIQNCLEVLDRRGDRTTRTASSWTWRARSCSGWPC